MSRVKRPNIVAEILQGLPEITARISYVDTLQLWTASPLSPDPLKILRSGCDKVRVFTETLEHRPDLRRRYLIQRPSPCAIEFLRANASYDHLINRVDVALDLIVAEVNEAQQLDVFFLRYKVQPWHGKRRMALCNGTAYASREKSTARNLVQYCDKPSKITGDPCVHLELRYKEAEACRRAGIEFLKDLVDLDLRKLWTKEFSLRVVDPRKLERVIDEVAGKKILHRPKVAEWYCTISGGNLTKREAVKRWIKGGLRDSLFIDGAPAFTADELHLALSQRWIEIRPRFAKRCLIPIPTAQFLPDNNHHRP